MKKKIFSIMAAMLVMCCTVFGCSDGKDVTLEEQKTEQPSQRIGQELANDIQKPLEEAQETQDMSKERAQEMDNTVGKE
ncbi:MAG: hypothetical protein V1753_07250 [Pseudomonadota bacterium]